MSKKKVKTDEELLKEALATVEEQPFDIPRHWKWVRLSTVCKINPTKIKTSASDDTLFDFLPMAGVSEIDGSIETLEKRFFGDIKQGFTQFMSNDILFAKITPCMENGKCCIVGELINEVGYGSTEFYVFRTKSNLYNRYLYRLLRSELFRKEAKQHMSGAVGQQRVPKKYLEEYLIPLPPLDEQKKIADKIERMLNKINYSKQLIEEAKQTFELRRAAILEKAFSGELTKKWREENYGTVSDLLNQLELCKQKKIDFGIPSDLGYKLYDIPNNWKWIRLENLIEFTAYGTSTKTSDEPGVPVIRMGNINDGKILMENFKYLPCDHPDASKYTLEVNDILFNRTNSYELVGKSAVVNELQAGKMTYASYLVNVRLHMKDVLSEYICQYINSHIGRGYLLSMVTQQVGQANINATKLASLMVPLPPISEIKYISNMLTKLKMKEEELQSRLDLETSIVNITNSILQLAFQGQLKSS